MKRFVEGIDRGQRTLYPERLEDWIGEDNPVRVIDVFVDELDLGGLGFGRVEYSHKARAARRCGAPAAYLINNQQGIRHQHAHVGAETISKVVN